MASLQEAIAQPLGCVQRLYAETGSDGGVKQLFAGLLADRHALAQVSDSTSLKCGMWVVGRGARRSTFRPLSQVPILTEETVEAIPNQTLVRYRGMVRVGRGEHM